MEYFGHVISSARVSTDPKKIEVMLNWPRLANARALRGFLGLTNYYRRFVRNYGMISKPLTKLLKKDGFRWDDKAKAAFVQLKQAMGEVLVLGLPNFNKPFVLETDASGIAVGVVLTQDDRPLAFFSQALAPRHQGLSTYDKELLAVLMVVDKWRHYLEGGQFVIETDHENLKFLLQQRLHTNLQRKGMPN